MPEKTVYTITEKGRKRFEKTLQRFLQASENIFSEFDIAVTLVCHLDRETALEKLEEHRIEIEREIVERKRQYRDYKKGGWLPYTGLIRRMHYIKKREAESKTINELIRLSRGDRKWEHYPVSTLYKHVLDKQVRKKNSLNLPPAGA